MTGPEKEALNILQPFLGEELAQAIFDYKKSQPSGRRFDSYRSRLLLKSLRRSPDPKLSAWEYLNRAQNAGSPSHEYVKACLIYDEATGLFRSRIARGNCEAGSLLGTITIDGYVSIGIAGSVFLAHRLAWFYKHSVWPEMIDHIDRNRANNAISNLRECTNQQNCWNFSEKSKGKSGFVGVTWCKKSQAWYASIRVSGKTKSLGVHTDIEDAKRAYDSAVIQYRGNFLERV